MPWGCFLLCAETDGITVNVPELHSEDEIARKYSRLVSREVRRLFLRSIGDGDDLYQEGMMGLLKAIRQYDPLRNDSFEAFATLCIRNRLYDAVRSDASCFQREEAAISHLIYAGDSAGAPHDPEAYVLDGESTREILDLLGDILSPFETAVLEPYLDGYSVPEIGRMLSKDPKAVHNAVGRIRKKLAPYVRR